MIKTYKEIQPGDIFRTEYGDYGNYVEIIFKSNEISDDGKWLKIIGDYKHGGEYVGYSPIYGGNVEKYDVVGCVEEDKNVK